MEIQSQVETPAPKRMLPPAPGNFPDREELISYVRDFGANQGYVVTIKKSKRDRRVILGCDRGGVYRNRRSAEEMKRKRKQPSRLINCPFEALGKKEDDVWVLTIRNGEHNHEPLKDMSEHPYSRRFTEEEIRQIKVMTDAGIRPLQILDALKKNNPELQSTTRDLYNVQAKLRQGVSEKCFRGWRPNRSPAINPAASGASFTQNTPPLKVPNFIGGELVESQSSLIIDVINPATQEVVSQVPFSTYEEFKAATNAAKQAFHSWRNTPVTTRQRIMFKLQELIRRDIDKLAMSITTEQGKTLKGARGDVLCGLEVVEQACGVANMQMADILPNACNGIDTLCIREPLGVCAGICPLNFPAVIPLWMFPIAVTCGNTFVLNPCAKNPGASMILAELAKEAGLPDGVLNIVHGSNEIINYICDDDDIQAISFIGSSAIGTHVNARAAARGKQVQSNIGSKNLAVIMPDADKDATMNALMAAAFGASGQSCMALSAAIFVGGSMPWEDKLVERAILLKVNVGTDPAADLGPVISKEEKDRVCSLVQSGVANGARLILDGTSFLVRGYERGNFVGPTILCGVTTDMECYKEEVFGPVLLCMQAGNLEEAISIVNKSRLGSGASLFTTSGVVARKFQNEVDAGLVGINVPVSVPLQFSSFNGPRSFFAGNLNFSARAGLHFYTRMKMVAQQWTDFSSLAPLSLPRSSRTDTISQGAYASLPTGSNQNSLSLRTSSGMHSEPERSSPSQVTPPLHSASEKELTGQEVSSIPSTSNTNLSNQEVSMVVLSTSENDLSRQQRSQSIAPAPESNAPSQSVSLDTPTISERTHLAQTSTLNETSPATSLESHSIPSTSERNNMPMLSIPSTSERKNIPMLSQNGNAASATEGTDTAMDLTSTGVHTSEGLHTPSSLKNDNINSTSQKIDGNGSTSHISAGRWHPFNFC